MLKHQLSCREDFNKLFFWKVYQQIKFLSFCH